MIALTPPDPSTSQGRWAIILNFIISAGVFIWCFAMHKENTK